MAKPNNPSADAGKKRDRKKGLLGAALSATIVPGMKKWAAQKAASLSQDHPLRNSEIFKRGWPALTTYLEDVSDELPIWLGALVEQAVDIADEFSGALDGTTRQQGKTSGAAIDDKWMRQFVSNAQKRLQNATNKTDEFARIKEELQLLKKLDDLIRNQGQDVGETAPREDATPAIRTFRQRLERAAADRRSRRGGLL